MKLPAHLVRQIAVEAERDPRTVVKVLAGEPVRSSAAIPVLQALDKLKLGHLRPAVSPRQMPMFPQPEPPAPLPNLFELGKEHQRLRNKITLLEQFLLGRKHQRRLDVLYLNQQARTIRLKGALSRTVEEDEMRDIVANTVEAIAASLESRR